MKAQDEAGLKGQGGAGLVGRVRQASGGGELWGSGFGGGQGGGVAGGGLAGFGGGVFAGAFGLELGGFEGAVAAVGADGEGLGVVLEGVRGRLGAFVVDFDGAALFGEDEVGVGAVAADASGLDVAGDAEVELVGLVAHGLELGDGDVVLFGVVGAGDGEPGDGAEDDGGGDDELGRGFAVRGVRRCGFGVRHDASSLARVGLWGVMGVTVGRRALTLRAASCGKGRQGWWGRVGGGGSKYGGPSLRSG
jgi:hypothetical protein